MSTSSTTMTLKFGTSGLRGLAADFNPGVCKSYVNAFLAMLEGRGETVTRIAIGEDLRPSSTQIAGWCADAAIARGVTVIDAGEVPTPALAGFALRRGIPALMITASHNPVEHNGIKFYRPDGELTKGDEVALRVHLKALTGPSIPSAPPQQVDPTAAQEYVANLVGLFGTGALAGMRLGIDQHSAVGRDLLVDILKTLGAECTVLRRSDTFIAVDTEAIDADYRHMVRGWLASGRYDAIVSTDGDGDRPLVFDEAGRQILGDELGILAARHLGYASVVTPVSSTSSVEACGWFDNVARSRIGSPYVIELMQQALHTGAAAVAGFEGNGGFLAGGRHSWRGRAIPELMTRDAVLPLVAVLAMAHERHVGLSQLARDLPHRVKATGRLTGVDTGRAATWIDSLVRSADVRVRALPVLAGTASTETIDGVRFLLKDGSSVHFRLSGNAPELRCYVETDDSRKSDATLRDALASATAALAAQAKSAAA